MGNIKKFKPYFDHANMYKDGRGLFVLGHFGMFGKYSEHPKHNSTVQDVCILTACRSGRLVGS